MALTPPPSAPPASPAAPGDAPSRANPSSFRTLADAFVVWLVGFRSDLASLRTWLAGYITWQTTNVTELAALQTDVASKQSTASAAASTATTAASAAVGAAAAAAHIYPGTFAADPTLRPDGTAIQNGDQYVTTAGTVKVRSAGAWATPTVNMTDLANSSDAAKGVALLGYLGTTLKAWLDGLVGTRGSVLGRLDAANSWTAAQTFEVPPVFTDRVASLAAVGGASIEAANTFESATQEFQFTSEGATGPQVNLRLVTTTPAPADDCGFLNFASRDSAGNNQQYAQIAGRIIDATNGTEDGIMLFRTTINGVSSTRMSLQDGLIMPGATGSDKGTGTINAVAVYDDNVLLTDYVFDVEIDGYLSVADASNARAQAFDAGALDLDVFAHAWRERRSLPAMPRRSEWTEESRLSVGELVQRLWETVEVQAVHIEKLNARMKALEAAR